jgi:hypothetical protein
MIRCKQQSVFVADRMRHHRGGFALIMSLVLVSLVAIAVLALMSIFHLEVRRTRTATNQTQLRQLLLAGASSTQAALTRDPARVDRINIPLPATLENRPASLWAHFLAGDDPQTRSVVLTAQFTEAHAQQTLVFTSSDNRWQLESAMLDRQR